MSWAEVKKAINTNINVPLNELIEHIDDAVTPEATGYQCVSAQNIGRGTYTILNVTGKGRLRGALIYDYHNTTSPTNCEIIIDGVSYVLQLKMTNSNNKNNGFKIFALLNPADILYNVSGSTTTCYVYGASMIADNLLPRSTNYKFIQSLDNVTNAITTPDVGIWMYLDKYIPFKESLVIKCTMISPNSGAGYGVCYRLDD